ncbi:MAG: HD domain-containing protein [Armatimonadetes bacterium]|nr:HD domain-containing protein [Armatimonadota bacterium]
MSAKCSDTTHLVTVMRVLRRAPSALHFRRNEHSKRVARLAEAVAAAMELPEAEVSSIRRAALLHDVGNVGLSVDVLLKPGPLTEEEFRHIQEHVHRGTRDVAAVETLRDTAPIVQSHHEWVNGAGYPEGLRGEAIPVGSRVVAAADAYVMMTARVPWRAARSHEEAIDELHSNAGTQLDEEIVARLVAILRGRGHGTGD